MGVLGIHIGKGQFFYAVLEGTKRRPILIKKNRLVTVDPQRVPQLMDWYDTQFRALLTEWSPERIAYRLTLNPNKEQILVSEYPLGVLNLLAHRHRIQITEFTASAFVPSKIGFPKGTDIYRTCDTVLGSHPPYWNKLQKHAVLAAWFEL